MHKLYAYVDENGQETKGRIFIVAVVVIEKTRDDLLARCERMEREAHKGRVKWRKTRYPARVAYLERIFADPHFLGVLRVAVFQQRVSQDDATITAIAHALQWHAPAHHYTSLVYIDALSKTKRHAYATALRKLGVPNESVQGVIKEENNALIRLADAVAGWVRDAADGQVEMTALCEEAKRIGVLLEV